MTQFSGQPQRDSDGDLPGADLVQEELAGKSGRRKLIERVTITGLGISVLVHLLLLLIAVLVRIDYGFADAGGGGADPVEFAILSQADLNEQTAVDVDEIEFSEIVSESMVDLNLLTEVGVEQSVSDLADAMAPELDSGGGSISDVDVRTGASGAGSGEGASFFGIEASGQRFAYIVDRSGSMNTITRGGELSRWELTQIELIRSVHGLAAHSDFFVVLYSSGATPLFGGSEWIKASKNNKTSTGYAMMSSRANGGTEPVDAFAMVLALDPKPDAVYFMTDGEFSQDVPGRVSQLNTRRRVPIHCILFGQPGSPEITRRVEGMLQNMARKSRGRYQHVRDASGGGGGGQP